MRMVECMDGCIVSLAHLQAVFMSKAVSHCAAQVHVPTGWFHQVVNHAPCVKVAYDGWEPSNYVKYLGVLQLVTRLEMLEYFATDYQALEPVLVGAANTVSQALAAAYKAGSGNMNLIKS